METVPMETQGPEGDSPQIGLVLFRRGCPYAQQGLSPYAQQELTGGQSQLTGGQPPRTCEP